MKLLDWRMKGVEAVVVVLQQIWTSPSASLLPCHSRGGFPPTLLMKRDLEAIPWLPYLAPLRRWLWQALDFQAPRRVLEPVVVKQSKLSWFLVLFLLNDHHRTCCSRQTLQRSPRNE